MTTRRGFLAGMLALGVAPAIVRAESLMQLWVPPQNVLTLDMLRQASRTLQRNALEPYVIIVHPSLEQAMRDELAMARAGRMYVLYRSNEVKCHD